MMKLNVKPGYGQKGLQCDHRKACGEEYCNKHLDMIRYYGLYVLVTSKIKNLNTI